MVKGVSRQVIVVQSPDQKLFEQAIFILKDEVVGKCGITDDMLLKTANKLLHSASSGNTGRRTLYGPIWACAGALSTALLWLMTVLL